MRGMGFSRTVLCWISSYIHGRRQKVISKSEGESGWLYTNVGVPQGSVLVPLLLSLYIDDLQHILKVEGDNNPRKDKPDKLQHFFMLMISSIISTREWSRRSDKSGK